MFRKRAIFDKKLHFQMESQVLSTTGTIVNTSKSGRCHMAQMERGRQLVVQVFTIVLSQEKW